MNDDMVNRECNRCGKDFFQQKKEWSKLAQSCPECRKVRPFVSKKELYVPVCRRWV